jgi:hypothetical protein
MWSDSARIEPATQAGRRSPEIGRVGIGESAHPEPENELEIIEL